MKVFAQRTEQRLHRLGVDARWGEQCCAERRAELCDVRGELESAPEEYFARERIAVRVQAGRGDADEHVVGLDASRAEHLLARDDAYRETGEVVLTHGIHVGEL